MNTQELFDKVATHLLTQNAKAHNPDDLDYLGHPRCMYRALDGKLCAVGCLITDENYNPNQEGEPARVLKNIIELSVGRKLLHSEVRLLTELQSIHDRRQVKDWRYFLTKLAEENELNTNAIDAIPEAA